MNIYIPINIFKEFINNELKKYFLKKFIIKKYFLKIIVYTSTKKEISKRVGKNIRDAIKVILKTA